MTKKERFFLGQVFEFLQQPHCYRFNSEDSMLYRNVNNSRVDFEPYARIIGFDNDGFDALLLKHEERTDGRWTMGHSWVYSDFHFGWGEEFRCTSRDYWKDMEAALTYSFGYDREEKRLDGVPKVSFVPLGFVIGHEHDNAKVWVQIVIVDGKPITIGERADSLGAAKTLVENAIRNYKPDEGNELCG